MHQRQMQMAMQLLITGKAGMLEQQEHGLPLQQVLQDLFLEQEFRNLRDQEHFLILELLQPIILE